VPVSASGAARCLSLAKEAGMRCRPGEPHLSGRADQDVGRLDMLVDEAALVELAQSHGNTDSDQQPRF
jgi:hypothetical protein